MDKQIIIADHPWVIIADELKARNWSQKKFAELIWLTVAQVNDLIKWRRNISPKLALSIGSAFWTSANLWLKLQNDYDIYKLYQDEKAMKKVVEIREKALAYA